MSDKGSNKLKSTFKAIEDKLGVGSLAKMGLGSFIKKTDLDNQASSASTNNRTDISLNNPENIFSVINETNDLRRIKLLLENEIDVNIKNTQGQTPLIKAILLNSQSIVRLLIQHGADVNLRANGITPLMLAAQKGLPYITVILIKANADINAQASDGMSIAMMAARDGHVDIIDFLFARDLNIQVKNSQGETALSIARQSGHEEVVKRIESTIKILE
jgi:ankyrin repeat protein